jgi:hypothetical protein
MRWADGSRSARERPPKPKTPGHSNSTLTPIPPALTPIPLTPIPHLQRCAAGGRDHPVQHRVDLAHRRCDPAADLGGVFA